MTKEKFFELLEMEMGAGRNPLVERLFKLGGSRVVLRTEIVLWGEGDDARESDRQLGRYTDWWLEWHSRRDAVDGDSAFAETINHEAAEQLSVFS